MGDTTRAEKLSSKFTNRTMQAVALFAFDKCGNCTHRLDCAEKLLSVGGCNRPIRFTVDMIMSGCPKEKYSSIGIIPSEVGGFLNNHCAKCDKFDICAGYISEHAFPKNTEMKEIIVEKLTKCANCENLPKCIHHWMLKMKISNFKLMKSAFLMRFSKCAKEDRCTTSVDMRLDEIGSVGGKITQTPSNRENIK